MLDFLIILVYLLQFYRWSFSQSRSHNILLCIILCMCIQYRRSLPYRADRSARYGKGRLYCMRVLLYVHQIYTWLLDHVKRGRKTLRLNGFTAVNFKQHHIKFESENQKSSPIILLLLFHSACPYKNCCLYLFIFFIFLLSL